jgi:competence protein ComEA
MNSFFDFNHREQKGIFLLLIIISLLIIWIQVDDYFLQPKLPTAEQMQADIQQLEANLEQAESEKDAVTAPSPPTVHLFFFNPNQLAEDKWKSLGLNDHLIKRIKNYEAKGGQFRKKEDLQKIYGFPPEQYRKLEPYILIPTHDLTSDHKPHQKHLPVQPIAIELNQADSSTLEALPGIGPAFAKRIVAYRNKLGGFCKIEQLKEVYGLDSNLYESLKPKLDLNPTLVHTLNINKADLKTLQAHPYIRFALARMIVNYREQHGAYANKDALKRLTLVTADVWERIAPYVVTE